jgi:peptidyl-prolyl cis-trans isomerase C
MRAFASMALVAGLMAAGCGTGEGPGRSGARDDTSRVLAVVGDVDITELMVEREIERMPLFQRESYDSPQGRRLLVDRMVDQELLLAAARDMGLENDPFVTAQVEEAMRQVEDARKWAVIQVYYQRYVMSHVTVPEEVIADYYNLHTGDIYHQAAQVRVSEIEVAGPADTAAVRTALEGGTPFGDVAMAMSTDNASAGNGGDIGWLTADSPIGNRREISPALFSAAEGEVLGPFETEGGWMFLTVTDSREEGTLPLDQVRARIENNLRPAIVDSYIADELLPSLREQYGVTLSEDAFLPDGSMDPDTLLQAARDMMLTDPEGAIQYFELLLERYPDDPDAQQTQFLIGFTYYEQLGDIGRARAAFRKAIDGYPESDITSEAVRMIENMGPAPGELAQDNGDAD